MKHWISACLLAWGLSSVAEAALWGVPIRLVAGTSAGALNATALAAGQLDLRPLDFDPPTLARALVQGRADGVACLSELGN